MHVKDQTRTPHGNLLAPGRSRSLGPVSDIQPPRAASSDPQRAFREAVLKKIRADLAAEEALADLARVEVLPRLRTIIATARADGVCREVWLFGSFAWGRPGPDSDLDLLVEGDADELAWRISRELVRAVDAWRLDDAPPSLVARARSEGIAL